MGNQRRGGGMFRACLLVYGRLAGMVKWTTHEPYMGLSESVSKLYTNLKFVKKKIINN